MESNGNRQTRLVTDLAADYEPVLSPGGDRVAFVSNRDGNDEIYVLELSSGAIARLTDSPTFDFDPAWSPDGSRLAFSSDRSGETEIYVMNADGSEPRRLTSSRARTRTCLVARRHSPCFLVES